MMNHMSQMGSMMWGMGLLWILFLVLLVLGVAGLLKYLLRSRQIVAQNIFCAVAASQLASIAPCRTGEPATNTDNL
jgi:hypothetical protein